MTQHSFLVCIHDCPHRTGLSQPTASRLIVAFCAQPGLVRPVTPRWLRWDRRRTLDDPYADFHTIAPLLSYSGVEHTIELRSSSAMDQFVVLQTLGKGSFGVVRKVRRKVDGKILVVKEMDYGSSDEKQKQQIVAEVSRTRANFVDHAVL